LIFLPVIRAAQTDNAQRIIPARENHAKSPALKRTQTHFPNLTVVMAHVVPADRFAPCDLARNVKRYPMPSAIHRVLHRIKRDVDVHSLWSPKREVTSSENSEIRMFFHPNSEPFVSLHSSASHEINHLGRSANAQV
jgi:hypothetical protein